MKVLQGICLSCEIIARRNKPRLNNPPLFDTKITHSDGLNEHGERKSLDEGKDVNDLNPRYL
ncbi:MAG: hypothetical protein ACYC7J_03065 [Syntrophales bacterium]